MNEKDLRNEDLVEFIFCKKFGFGFGKGNQLVIKIFDDQVYSTLELDSPSVDDLRKIGEMFLFQARKLAESK
jgi:hypothetical protein